MQHLLKVYVESVLQMESIVSCELLSHSLRWSDLFHLFYSYSFSQVCIFTISYLNLGEYILSNANMSLSIGGIETLY